MAVGVTTGAGSPEGAVTLGVGSLYLQTDIGTLWRKALGTGNTGWVRDDFGAFNVMDFGAKGDGTTDDTAALVAAHAAVPSRGGILLLPYGVYRTTASWTLSKRVLLQGAGGLASVAGAANRGASVLLKDGNFTAIDVTGEACTIADIQVDGAVGNGGAGIVLRGTRPRLKNIIVTSQGGDGVRIGGSAGENVNAWRIDSLQVVGNGGHGLQIHDGTDAVPNVNAGVAIGVDARSNNGDGVRCSSAFDNQFFGITCQSNAGVGVHCVGTTTRKCQGQTFWFPYTESNSGGESTLEANADYNFIFGARAGATIGDSVTDNGTNNFVLGHNSTNVAGRYLKTILKYLRLRIDNPAISGYWDIYKDAADRRLILELGGTAADPVNVKVQHSDSAKRVRLTADGANCGTWAALTYSASITPDLSRANHFYVAVTNGTAFTVNNPTNMQEGQLVSVEFRNLSGGAMGAVTFGGNFLLAGAFVAPANSFRRVYTWVVSNGLLIEQSRSAADI